MLVTIGKLISQDFSRQLLHTTNILINNKNLFILNNYILLKR